MRQEESSTDSSAHFSDVWAAAQQTRSVVFVAFVLKTWRQLVGIAYGDGDRPTGKPRECGSVTDMTHSLPAGR
jgi:hypothetical protein